MGMWLRWIVLGSLALSWLRAPPAAAEDPAPASPHATPPRALHVPPVLWPASLPPPSARVVEALIVVGRDGLAQLEHCGDAREVCDALGAALLEARFAPAIVGGQPSAARVQVRFSLRVDTPPAEAAPKGPPAPQKPTASPPPPEAATEFGAVARVQEARPTAIALELEEMREVPGSLGDPFRVIEALPGVVPVLSGLPYVYVRGAPPAATTYYFDDVQLPALFHLALGPAVVHPAMIGPVDFYPGVAPARYGRKTGGVVAGQAAFRPLEPGVHGELELRLIDMQAYVATPLPGGGRVEVGGRYGYPGLITTLIDPTVALQYWDYQTRVVVPISTSTEVSLLALGSYDLVGQRREGREQDDVSMQFHRVDARATTRRGPTTVGYALGAGYEKSSLGEDFRVTSLRMTPRLWVETRWGPTRVRTGADFLATSGRLEDPLTDGSAGEGGPVLIQNPIYRSAAGRGVAGAYTEVTWPFAGRWELEAGARGDLYMTGGDVQTAVEPRLLVRHQVRDDLALHAAGGLSYQPAVFLIPLPGIADVALDRGLQRAIQTELGGALTLPASFSAETKLFAHFYDGMLSLDALDEDDFDCDPDAGACEEGKALARMSAHAYGAELLLRRSYRETVSGWLAYTLSKADGARNDGRPVTPNFDVRHVANLVLQWRISRGWHVSARGYVQSGRFPLGVSADAPPPERRRLPAFARGDLQVSRLWQRPWGELRFTFDWLNFTLQREPLSWDCSDAPSRPCKVENTGFPVTIPMLGVRGTY